MLGWRRLALAGLATFVLCLLLLLPAQLAGQLAESLAGIRAGNWSGTLWHGEVLALQVGQLRVNRASWKLSPLSLLTGRVSARLDAELAGGFARGQVGAGLGGLLEIEDFQAALPVRALPLPSGLAPASGQLSVDVERLVIDDGWPQSAVLTAQLADLPLALPGVDRAGAPLGRFEGTIAQPEIAPEEPIIATVRDRGGMLELAGTLSFKPPSSYELNGVARARDGAGRAVEQALNLLGPPNADGGHVISIAGSL